MTTRVTRREALRLLGAGAVVAGSTALGACTGESAAGGGAAPEVPNLYPIDGPPAVGDAYVSGTIGEASTFIAFLSSDASSAEVASMVQNSLVRYNDRIELEGEVAERFDVSPDGQTITFHLRRDVRWTDGHPLTAEDVLFTYRAIIDPETPTPYADDYLQVKRAEAPDPYTFRVHYDRPFAPALESWGLNILPAHILRGQKLAESRYGREPVGSGPYMLRQAADWVPGQRMTLVRNPDYWEGTVWIERQIIRVIPDLQTQFLELKTGGLDGMGLTPPQYKFQTNTVEFRSHFEKYRYLAAQYTYLGFNLRDPRFADKRVRQAFAYAINKDEIIRGALLGYGVPISVPVRPTHWVYNPDTRTYPYDPQKALTLLKEAGWTRDANGRQVKGGKPFRFEILTNQGNAQRQRAGEIIQQRLADIGVEVSVRQVEWAAFVKDFLMPARFEAYIGAWTTPPDPDQFVVWHSSQIEKGLNRVAYRNPEVDDLLEQGRRTFDREMRKRIYARFQEIMAEEQPYVFLYVPEALFCVHKRIKGIVPTPNGIGYKSPVRWYVPKAYQKWTDVA